MPLFLEVTLLPKMSERDKREAERDDITEVDQEKVLRHMPRAFFEDQEKQEQKKTKQQSKG